MNDFYNIDAISKILNVFKVDNAIISGVKDKNLINSILKHDASFTHINTNDSNCISDNPLNALQKFENYDAIFIDDDPNWYTLINELKIIKNTNHEFPLVFICNNNFPNKRRDSYLNPDNIPANFRQEYTNKLTISFNNEKIIISDGFYHACDENTPKNGVSTAIEDFLDENSHIGTIKINFIKEICILYSKSQINQKRIKIIEKNIQTDKNNDINLSDKLIENEMLISYINKYELFDDNLIDMESEISKKDSIIKDYETKIRHQTNQINLNDSKISGFESNLSLKESQIKNIESKLVNKDRKIKDLENQIKTAKSDLNTIEQESNNKNDKINNLENQLKTANSDFDFLTQKINETADEFSERESYHNNKINALNNKIKQNEIDFKNTENKLNKQLKAKDNELANQINTHTHQLKSLKRSYMKKLSELDNEKYCISCLKEEIANNKVEIEYFKNNNITKKILSPIGYLYLIVKSKPKEISLNIKLYRTLKNSKCFDIGFYLHKNKDLINSKWCKYFSPELHYICNGFEEDRTFNKKYFNRNSKKELLEYVLNCDK